MAKKRGLIVGESVVGPWRIVRRDGAPVGITLAQGETPTEEECQEMLLYILQYEDLGAWMQAHFIANVPKDYGNTFHLAQKHLPKLRQSTIDSYRQLGKRCPPEKVRPEFSFSHHKTIYVDYAGIVGDDTERWFDLLKETANSPGADGHTLSVMDLRARIVEHYKMLPQPQKKDQKHELLMENVGLRRELDMAEGSMAILEEFLEQSLIPKLQEADDFQIQNKLVPALKAAILDVAVEAARPNMVKEWYVVGNSQDEGCQIMATLPTENGDVTMYTFDERFPPSARQELATRLRARVR